MRSSFFLSFIFIFLPCILLSQNLDSLVVEAKKIKDDSAKIRRYNKLAFSYIFNDTEKAKELIIEARELAKKSKFDFGFTELTNTYGIYYDVTGKTDSAKYYFEKALKLSRDYNFKNIESMCINNLGMFNWNNGNYNEALTYFFDSLKMYEAQDNEKATAGSLNNIGLIYQEMNLNEKALENHYKSLELRKKYDLIEEQVSSYNNIGVNLKELGRIDEAIKEYKTGIELAKTTNNQLDLYRLLDNLGNAYNLNENYDLAIETYEEILNELAYQNLDEKSRLGLYGNMASTYNSIGQPDKAMVYLKKGFELVKKYPEIESKSAELNIHAAETNYMLGNFEKAREQVNTFIELRDTQFSEQNAQSIADLEVKYDTEKKEKEILVQRAELAEQKLTIQQKNYQLYGLIGLTLVLGLIGFLFYNQQKLKNQQLKKENELKDALIKIETQNRLQEQRLRISRDLHDNIGAQLTFIISSIDNLKYGFKIEDEKLTTKLEKISEFASSTIYELRDTIWAMNKNEITIEDLKTRISNYIEKADLSDDNISFSFDIDASINQNRRLSSVEGMNIYRIIQEAIHNSLKHANAKVITVNISEVENRRLKIEIKDDGQGFDQSKTEKGNGLTNMKKRAQNIAAEVSLVSSLERGTKIILKV
ncbi:MAG: tetratricopeptide repeat protein [Bacteroidota bacterium]